MAIQPETIAGRKKYIRRKREELVATWWPDSYGNIHIPLEDGHEAVISNSKKAIASQFSWHLKKHSVKKGKLRGAIKLYAETCAVEELRDRYGKHTSLHRVVADAPPGIEVDHKDGNGLNATRSQNACNRHYANKSGYRGVVIQKNCTFKKFMAQIEYGGENHRLGSYPTAIEAAMAYNAEAKRMFGDFAVLNQVEENICQL